MANEIEQRGFFWWFNEPTRPANSKQSSVPGLLTVAQTGQVTLDLDGALAEDREHADWSRPRSFGGSRIVGLLDTPGDYILLEGVERTDFSLAGEDSPKKQSFSAKTCTRRGFPFPDDYEQHGFIELRIDMKGLEEWLNLEYGELRVGVAALNPSEQVGVGETINSFQNTYAGRQLLWTF